MGSRVVRPAYTRLTISDGDWIQVKQRLNHGEQQDAFARRYLADGAGSRLNLRMLGMETVIAYLVDWSLTGLDDQVIEIRGKSADEIEAVLNTLEPESFAEIRTAIEQHAVKMAADREAAKNGKGGATGSAAISPLPFAVDGVLTGSAS